jgi:16S rRNA (cytidine1402-2'-O)-methyltransferase
VKQLEARAYNEDQTQLFIETPYRNARMMQTLISVLRSQTRVCLASNITCQDEQIRTRTVSEWKQLLKGLSDEQLQRHVPRVPSIFLIFK